MQKQTVEFIKFSELFNGFKRLSDNFAEFCREDFSVGDNIHSLNTIEDIFASLDNKGLKYSDKFKQKCEEIGLQTLVDMEH